MSTHSDIYREEAYELLSELESALLDLEETPDDMELIGRIFRAMHTIKGSGAMFGFDEIAAFTHDVETVYDLVRDEIIPVTKELIDLTLTAGDLIKKMVDGEMVDKNLSDGVIELFREMIPPEDELAEKEVSGYSKVEESDEITEQTTYRIRFRPNKDIFAKGTNPALLIEEIKALGECRVIAQTSEIPALKEMDPESCYIYWDLILTTRKTENAIRDVFIFVEDESEITIRVIEEEGLTEEEEDYKRLGEILVEKEDLKPEDLEKTLDRQKMIGEMLVEEGKVDPDEVRSALEEQDHIDRIRKKRKEETSASSIRVTSDKLDTLVDLVGELVTVQARLGSHSASKDDSELLSISEEVERLTSELRDNTMSIRMLPIGTTFRKFKRLVRDLSNELGKEVVLTTEGGETELDKTVIERLNDPMVHIIRNCIDHGIESPKTRTSGGKSSQGKVHLSAVHAGGNVIIKISDDGAGLNEEAIRAKAIEREIIAQDAELSEKEAFSLIFEPGFSTADTVTGVSGRGVGMDVVKRSIESLRGSIDVDSSKGEGTTITLKLPLTLAIIDGLLLDIGRDYYVMPLAVVEECVEMTRNEAERARERHMMSFRGNVVPYISLRHIFNVEGTPPDIEQIVVAESNGELVGFGVDRLVGQNQTVIKTLNKLYKDVMGLSGATILGDGTVALILDVAQLVQSVEKH